MSRIGKKPLVLPKEIKVQVQDHVVTVEGPKGTLQQRLSDRMDVQIKDGQLFVSRKMDTKLDRSLHGLSRALILNMIKGVTEGYTKEMEIIGVGFRAQVQAKSLTMLLGFSHPVEFPIPDGITIEAPKPTQLIIRGIDKQKVGQVASEIRAVYPPEPFKGKGIRFAGEYIKKKVGKAQATAK